MADTPADVPPSRFQVIGQLGRDALAEVYLCKLLGVAGFEKEVVVKRISAACAADPAFVEMFLDEARVAAGLTHPNIVQVFEVGEEDGAPYIAMEYVRGVTLGMVIRRAQQQGKIHHGHFAAIIAKICDALTYAHAAVDQDGEPVGLVHREVSPANIVVNLDGTPKLIDFGMAAARDRLLHNPDGGLELDLRYTAPEQMSRGHVDHRADVFSLGITLFELTTGFNPFGTEDQSEAEVSRAVLNAPVPRPSQVVPGYPPALEKIVLSAIERIVDKRCPSARELGERLEAFALKKEYLSTPRSLAAWMRDLFPDFTPVTRASEVTVRRSLPTAPGAPPTVPSSRRPTGSGMLAVGTAPAAPPAWTKPSPLLQTGPRRASTRRWAALGALGLAVAVAGWSFTRTSLPLLLPPSSTAPSVAPVFAGRQSPPARPPSTHSADPARQSSAQGAAQAGAAAAASEADEPAAVPGQAEKPAAVVPEAEKPSAVADEAEKSAAVADEAEKSAAVAPEAEKPAAVANEAEKPAVHAAGGPTAGSAPRAGGARESTGGFRVRSIPRSGPRRLALDGPRRRGPRSTPAWIDRISRERGESGPRARLGLLPPATAGAPAPAGGSAAAARDTPLPLAKANPFVPGASPSVPAGGLVPARREVATRTTGSSTFSAVPRNPIPPPTLPRQQNVKDAEQLARVCQAVERATVSQAGVSAEFASGITSAFRKRIRPGSTVYPIAMYHFIVREAALRHDSVAAANNLASAHDGGVLLQMRNLAGVERPL